MKTLNNIRILLFSLSFIFIVGFGKKVNAQPGITVSFQQFYDELSPYGEWIDDPDYGYIWVPNVDPDFQPYATNGRWVMTDYGNTWVSNYDWGWAPFHYGRWNYNRRFGWCWVPGYEWGPAWVGWRSGGGYYGWAPLGPGVSIGININIPSSYWIFVPQRYILSTSIHRYYAPRRTVVNVYNRTTIINNTYVYNNHRYYSGPRRSDIQRITRSSVPVHRISNASRPGSGRITGRSLEIYRPNVSRSNQARPARITSADNIRSSANRSNDRKTDNFRGGSTTRPSSRNGNIANRASGRIERSPYINGNEKTERPNRSSVGPSRNPSSETRIRENRSRIQEVPNNIERPGRVRSSAGSARSNGDNAPGVRRSERQQHTRPSGPSRMPRNEQPRIQRSEQPRSNAPSRSERPSRGQDRPERISRNIRG